MIEYGAFTPIKSLKIYDLNVKMAEPYLINDLPSLGWPDPYFKPIAKGNNTGETKFGFDMI